MTDPDSDDCTSSSDQPGVLWLPAWGNQLIPEALYRREWERHADLTRRPVLDESLWGHWKRVHASREQSGVWVLSADALFGKSAFASGWFRQGRLQLIEHEGDWGFVVGHFFRKPGRLADVRSALRSLTAQLCQIHRLILSVDLMSDEKLAACFFKLLKEAGSAALEAGALGQMVVLDGLDEASDIAQLHQAMGAFSSSLPPGIMLVLTGRDGSVSPVFDRMANAVRYDLESHDEIMRAEIREVLGVMNQGGNPLLVEQDLLSSLADVCAPYLGRAILLLRPRNGLAADLEMWRKDKSTISRDPVRLVEDEWTRLTRCLNSKQQMKQAKAMLGWMALAGELSRESFDHLAGALSASAYDGPQEHFKVTDIPEGRSLAEVMKACEYFLERLPDGKGGVHHPRRPFHVIFSQVQAGESSIPGVLLSSAELDELRKMLAHAAWHGWKDDAFALAHAGKLLKEVGRFKDLAMLLLNREFLLKRVEEGGGWEMLEDFPLDHEEWGREVSTDLLESLCRLRLALQGRLIFLLSAWHERVQGRTRASLHALFTQELRHGLIHDLGNSHLNELVRQMEEGVPEDVSWLRLERGPGWQVDARLRAAVDLGNNVGAVAMARDEQGNRYVVAGCRNGMIHLLFLKNGRLSLRWLDVLVGHEKAIVTLALDAKERVVASVSEDETIRLWGWGEEYRWRALHVLTGHTQDVCSLALDAPNRLLVTGAADGTIRLWSWDHERWWETQVLTNHAGAVTHLAFDAAAGIMASGAVDETMRLWKRGADQWTEMHVATGGSVYGLALDAGRGRVAFGTLSGLQVWTWDECMCRELEVLPARFCPGMVVALDAGMQVCVCGIEDGHLLWQSWGDGGWKHWQKLGGLPFGMNGGIALDASERMMVTGSDDGVLCLWGWPEEGDLRTDEAEGHESEAVSAKLDVLTSTVFTASGRDEMCLWTWAGQRWRVSQLFWGNVAKTTSMALDAGEKLLVLGSTDQSVRLWRWGEEALTLLHVLEGHADAVTVVDVDATARLVASGAWDTTVRLWTWDEMGWKVLHVLKGHAHRISCLKLDAAARVLATGADDCTVRLWTWDEWEWRPMHTLEGHTGSVEVVSLDATSGLLASGSFDNTARLWTWDVGQWRMLDVLEGHASPVTAVALNAPAQRVATGCWDGIVRLWNVPDEGRSASCLAMYEVNWPVMQLQFHPVMAGCILVTCMSRNQGDSCPMVYELHYMEGPTR